MLQVLPQHGGQALELAITLLFGALFGWISIGFWTALLGFFVLATRRDRFSLTQLVHADTGPLNAAARTALVMPVFEEPVERVFAGLHAIYRSLERTGHLDNFDLFILSDTADADAWVREEQAWARLCRRVGGFGRIFYRRRRARIKRKSGNVAEFLRAWGNRYRYMVCLDADSIMAGNTIVSMVRAMERTPDAGMIQTAPTAFGRRSTFGRVHQFAMRLYGPMFTAGLHFWQLGDGQYWGHNAIIRIAPFMDHCGLGRLPGKPPLGGEILSHDFVEAALMGRAGWSLWLAYDLGGSWEQIPSSLLEEMKRDRRWCQGNLQHLRLVFTKGIFGAHRALFVNGALSYVSALLWFGFLVTSTVEAILNAIREPVYFPEGRSLFPQWPVWHADWALALLAVTGVILFASKLLAVALVAVQRQSRDFGGLVRLTFSVIVEIMVSSLFAPIRMVFHTRFVAMNLLGRTVVWKSGPREDSETGWGEALRHHGVDTVIASAWGTALFLLNPYYFFWILPVIGALVLSVPISVLASRVRLGDWVRRAGLFVIPEESNPPTELRELDTEMHALHASNLAPDGLLRAGVDPSVNALHRGLLGGPRRLRPDIRGFRDTLLARALGDGAAELTSFERRVLLSDPQCVDEIHRRAWSLPPAQAERWLADFRS
jgi:membrane glycosyltransferase